MERVIHVRVPMTGLPATGNLPEVEPYASLRMSKYAFGLIDAPRLWYLRARELVIAIGFEEFKCASGPIRG